MPVIESHVDARAAEFRENRAHMDGLVADLRERLARAAKGGGEEAARRQREQGKLPVRERVERLLDRGTPFLGVCLGMQVLLDTTEEGEAACLGIVPGRVRRLPAGRKVPHMGWNQVELRQPHPVFDGVPSGSNFYFVHSYYCDPAASATAIGLTDYGAPFCSVIARDRLVATQFHPEKSSTLGLLIYRNFVQWASDVA